MSNIRFNDKDEINAITCVEFIPITDGTNDYKVEVDELANYYTIPTIKSNISTNTLDIQELQGLVFTNTLDIQELQGLVSTNTLDIQNLENYIIPGTSYSVNSGLTSINKVSDTEVSFTLGASGMVITFPNGKTYTLTTVNNVTGISADGAYDFIIEEADIVNGNTVTPKAVLSSKVNETQANGTGGSDGDYNLNIQVRPLYPEKKISGTWTYKEYLKLGGVVKTGGTLGTPYVYAFNGISISDELTFANNAITSFNHNLGLNFKYIISDVYVICKTSEFGWPVGDITKPLSNNNNNIRTYGIFSSTSDTNISFKIQVNLVVVDRHSADAAGITPANWKMIFFCKRAF